MTRSKAIAKYCLDCSANSTKEVNLCHVFDCPLWEWRTGKHISTITYKRRIKKAMARNKADLKELEAMGVKISNFTKSVAVKAHLTQKTNLPNGIGRGK